MKRFLIVEDELVSMEILRFFLSQFAQCDCAHDGKVALEMFEQAIADEKPYHLICSDINMPVMGGHELVRLIRLKEKSLPAQCNRAFIFMISSSDTPKDMTCAILDNDCDDYVVKPFQLEQLKDVLEKYDLIDSDNNT